MAVLGAKGAGMEIRNCPFCGGNNFDVINTGGDDPAQFAVWCSGCASTSTWCDTDDQAIEAWNNRSDETRIRREVIEECAKVVDSMYTRSIGHIDGLISKEQTAIRVRALAEPEDGEG